MFNTKIYRAAPKSKQLAFTMIELLVVLTIVSTLIGLVGPLTLNSIEKHQAKAEETQLKRLISRYSNYAFIQGSEKTLYFEGFSVFSINKEEERYKFSYINFIPQTLQFNSSGIPQLRTLHYKIVDKQTDLAIFEIIYD